MMRLEPMRIYLVRNHLFKSDYANVIQSLHDDEGIVVVGETEIFSSHLYYKLKPHLLVLGVKVFNESTREWIRQANFVFQGLPIVVISDSDVALVKATQSRVDGCILVGDGIHNVLADLRLVFEGNVVVSNSLTLKAMKMQQRMGEVMKPYESLTSREREVLRYLSCGMQNNEIGHELGISQGTVQYHVSHIIRKFGCHNRQQLRSLLSPIIKLDNQPLNAGDLVR